MGKGVGNHALRLIIILLKKRKKDVPEVPQGVAAEEDGLKLGRFVFLQLPVMHAAKPTARIRVALCAEVENRTWVKISFQFQ